jgi:hypothetical protein
MTIERTGIAERRRDRRLGVRLVTLDFDGQFYATRNWSLGGFLIDGYLGTLGPSETAPVAIIVEEGSRIWEQDALVSVVRTEDDGQRLAARFNGLASETFDLLDGWQTGRLQRHSARATV